MKTIPQLRDVLTRIQGEQDAIFAKARTEERDFTADETVKLQTLNAEFEKEQGQLAILEAVEDNNRFLNESRGRQVPLSVSSSSAQSDTSDRRNGNERKTDSGYRKAGSFGRFAQSIAKGRGRGEEFAERVMESCFSVARQRMLPDDSGKLQIDAAAASTFASEAVDSEGALLIPPDYSTNVNVAISAPDSLLSMTNPVPVQGNGMVFPVDETTPWGTGGVQAYWQAEGVATTASKPKGEPRAMRLKKLMCLVPVTNELLDDANALETWITRSVASRFNWKLADAIVNGNGVGQPLGFASGAGLITQGSSAGGANTIKAADVSGMYSKLIPESMSSAVWLVSPTAFAQLPLLVIGQMPIWQPNFQIGPAGSLLGRPVIISMACQTLGTLGDIYLAGLGTGYASIIKSGGVNSAISTHLYFDADQSAFRFTFRMDGMPWLKAAPTVAYGSATIGHFVAFTSTRT